LTGRQHLILSSCEMFEDYKKPVIFAHRGACALAPENTIASFELAVAHGADAVELDAKLSREGQVMVIHDPTLERTTSGKGKVNEFTLKELKTLDAGSKFGSNFAGEKIPTLQEVFEHVGNKLLVNVELTNYKSPQDDLIPRVVELVKKQNMQQRVLFSSFLPKNLLKIRTLLPEAAVAQLSLPGFPGMVTRSNFIRHVSPAIIHPYLTDVSERYVRKEHSKGRRVHVWTVNQEKDLLRMLALNVDGIFTDDPKKARSLLAE